MGFASRANRSERRAPRWPYLASALALVLAASTTAVAYEELTRQLPARGDYRPLFAAGKSFARVQDGLLHGRGTEILERLPNGNLRAVREKIYHSVRHPETRKLVALSPPWKVRSTLELTPALRLVYDHTMLELHAPRDEAIAEHFESLFEWDESRIQANASGTQLSRVLRQGAHEVQRERYDYPGDAIPIEIVGTALSAALYRQVDRFDFDLLLPGGSTHGVTSVVHRVSSAARYAKGYVVPVAALNRQAPLAVIELRLSSPLKYLLYSHHFFFAYSATAPGKLLGVWGGDPDENLQAFRTNGSDPSRK